MTETTPMIIEGLSEIRLSYKPKVKASMRPNLRCAKDAYDLLLRDWDPDKIEFVEQFKVLLCSRANQAIGVCEISTGSSTGTIADPKLIFAVALKSNACGIILAHNHPSGNLKPSAADIALTKKIAQAGELFEMTVLDHIIMTAEGFYSFADEGLM